MSQPLKTRCVVTGFEPFGGSTLNPSWEIVEDLANALHQWPGIELHTARLPVDTRQIEPEVDALWQRFDPHLVLHFGESAKADRLTLERVALNLLDFDSPDNAGQRVVNQAIDPAGPAARFVTLPVRAIRDRLKGQGIEAVLSLSAGAYLCNQALYLSLAQAEQRGGRHVGFVHTPSLPEQVQRGERDGPSMPREQLTGQARSLIKHAVELFRADETSPRH